MILVAAALLIASASSISHSFPGDAPLATTSHITARSEPDLALQPREPQFEGQGFISSARDTLWNRIRGGEILIMSLPGELGGEDVERYSLVRAPALSWLIDRSFMWRTLTEDVGTHEVLLHAAVDSISTDTLVLSIVVE
jgi:hypothetical protein